MKAFRDSAAWRAVPSALPTQAAGRLLVLIEQAGRKRLSPMLLSTICAPWKCLGVYESPRCLHTGRAITATAAAYQQWDSCWALCCTSAGSLLPLHLHAHHAK
eukprot:28224-Chlamydomonas_euryale.AAC.13